MKFLKKSSTSCSFTPRRVKTPTLIQIEMAECGAACLGIILGYYKKYIPLEDLRIACNINRDGSHAGNIMAAAEMYGLETTGYSYELEELNHVSLPAILYWNFEHFVVLEGFGKNKVYINDPAMGPRTISYQELDYSFSGVVLCFEKMASFEPSGRPKSMLPGILERLKLIPWPLVYTFLSGLALVVVGLAVPAFSQVFIDQIIANDNFSWMWGIIGGMLLTVVIIILLSVLQEYILYRTNLRLFIMSSAKTFWHMLRVPFAYYTQRFPGEIAYRIAANETISKAISTQIVPIIINVILITIYGLAMLYYDVIVALIGFAVIGLNLVAIRSVYKSKMDAYARYQSETGKSVSYSLGLIGNIGNIKEMGMEYKLFPTWAGHYTKVQNAFLDISKKNLILDICPTFFETLSMAAVLGIGGWKVIVGSLTVGMLVALQILMRNLLHPVMELVNLSETIQFLKIDISRLDDVNQFPIEAGYLDEDKKIVEKKLQGYLEVQDLCFAYGPLSENILHEINFELSPGKTIALVGPTGSGKSTLAKVISGLYPPRSGNILFDGKPREMIARITLKNSLAVVEQFPFLFQGTVKDNLTLLDPTIELENILSAAKDACIHELILSRKGGYEFIVDQGGINLSGGEKQCFEIARALTRNPSILILDEATSTLDSEIEQEIITHLRRRGIALLMIAHRLSTVKSCDEIIVLDKGKIVAKGIHDELKETPGIYQELIFSEDVEG